MTSAPARLPWRRSETQALTYLAFPNGEANGGQCAFIRQIPPDATTAPGWWEWSVTWDREGEIKGCERDKQAAADAATLAWAQLRSDVMATRAADLKFGAWWTRITAQRADVDAELRDMPYSELARLEKAMDERFGAALVEGSAPDHIQALAARLVDELAGRQRGRGAWF